MTFGNFLELNWLLDVLFETTNRGNILFVFHCLSCFTLATCSTRLHRGDP